jgi:hypothetical protein
MSEEKTGRARLFDALTTKGTAFTHPERRKLGLLGLLPTAEQTLAQQAEHCWHEFSTRPEDLDKHIYLRALQDRNETGCAKFLEYSVKGTSLNTERIAGYVDNSAMLVTALSPVIGYQNAAHIAEAAVADNTTLREAALASGKVTAEQFDSIVKPINMIGDGLAGA